MELHDLTDGLIYLGYLAGAVAAIGVVVRVGIVRPLKTWIRELLREQIATVRDPLAEVHAEVTPNHGSSMKDAVARIEQQQTLLAQRLTDHLANHPGAS